MKKKIGIIVLMILIVIAGFAIYAIVSEDTTEIRTVKSEAELEKIYDGEDNEVKEVIANIFGMPFSILRNFSFRRYYNYDDYVVYENTPSNVRKSYTDTFNDITINNPSSVTSTTQGDISTKNFSTTNIQVENVDEADITKTDGDYIYSISENNVVITDVKNPKEIKIASKISLTEIPEDLILNDEKLVVITAKSVNNSYTYNGSTVVKIYDITSRENPSLIKSYELNQPYYTSRCINGELFVIASGYMKRENGKIVRTFSEDNVQKEIELSSIKYLKDVKTRKETLISSIDLNDAKQELNVSSYLMDVSNAYVSENAIYLLEQKYDYRRTYIPPVGSIFGIKGVFGLSTWEDDYYDPNNESGYYTQIFKFDIAKDGKVNYSCNTKIKGKTINQYSLDEYNKHLRIALYDYEGARVAIFDEGLKQIGITPFVAKGENMYSSRFMGNKAYLVTYRNMDPLFVIDLSDETNPRFLGELHIPGYSTYLHPYDETHLIGIGMQTEETVRRDSEGKVISTSAQVVGMKMALFDVSNVNNPKQMSEVTIGDRRTTSAILTNPKALLFSKERELIAIPVNNYIEDVDYGEESENYENSINTYIRYNKPYVGEGYFVCNINLTDGFKLKGTITHVKTTSSKLYYYGTTSKLLRGLYIDENLYTVSEDEVKVNNLDTLEPVSELKITK